MTRTQDEWRNLLANGQVATAKPAPPELRDNEATRDRHFTDRITPDNAATEQPHTLTQEQAALCREHGKPETWTGYLALLGYESAASAPGVWR